MNPNLNWNRERWRTRDRLIEYDFSIVPPHPHSAGIPFVYPMEDMDLSPMLPLEINNSDLPIIYPWEEMHTALIEREIYLIARKNGYDGTPEQLWDIFSAEGFVISGTIETFPVPGNPKNLYLDEETGVLYYYRELIGAPNYEAIEAVGAVIVGTGIYIPVRALLMEDTILNCGNAAEYID